MAANQVGKSYCGAAETAFHLTGDYPADWLGRRWVKPIKAWAIGESGTVVRDTPQKLLFGPPGIDHLLGSGLIPREAIVERPSLARGVTDGFDTAQIKHLAPDGASVDGISTLVFKTYEQGRTKLQSDTIDFFWCDEEPPEVEYSEILTRITATKGCGIITFTPLKGMSNVVLRFLNPASNDLGAPSRHIVTMTIDDALHISPEERAIVVAGYRPHEVEARARGIPVLGSGRVFTSPEADIMEPAIEYLPEHWTKAWFIDFGIDHPFAAVLQAWDKDADVLHILHTIRVSNALPMQQARAMQSIAGNIPVGWPHDGENREKGTGETLASVYKGEKLLTLPTHVTWPDGGISVEAGILEMDQRMKTQRYKVASHLGDWFEEYRLYHRENGLIKKVKDDLMDSSRLGVMGRRYGKPLKLIGGVQQVRRGDAPLIAHGVDFDPFGS